MRNQREQSKARQNAVYVHCQKPSSTILKTKTSPTASIRRETNTFVSITVKMHSHKTDSRIQYNPAW